MSAPQPGDKAAGFSGLILGAIVLFVMMFAIVRMTNAKYAGHAAAPAPSATTTTTGH
jgi:hypothetical protein